MQLPQKLLDVVDHFSRLQGIGEKTALRHALALSRLQKEELLDFSRALIALSELKFCAVCGVLSENSHCSICENPHKRDEKTLCVVESFVDCLAIEKSGQFKGLFHVLGGVLNPLLGIGPEELNFETLIGRIKKGQFQNIILAINPSVEGDATCSYIKNQISSFFSLNVERIGFGIPMGGSLEYLDAMTISKALENRRRM